MLNLERWMFIHDISVTATILLSTIGQCICVYVYIYIYVYVCIYIYIIQLFIHIYIIYIYISLSVCIYIYIYNVHIPVISNMIVASSPLLPAALERKQTTILSAVPGTLIHVVLDVHQS